MSDLEVKTMMTCLFDNKVLSLQNSQQSVLPLKSCSVYGCMLFGKSLYLDK